MTRAAIDVRPPAVEVRQVYRFFHAGHEEVLALRGVSFDVAPGELVAISGPSGSGKSTLLAAIAGLDDPDGGIVLVAGERMSHQPERDRARLRRSLVGVLYQSNNLVGHLTVTENVRLVRALTGHRSEGTAELIDAVGLTGRAYALPEQLSGGEAARAGLAVALAGQPAVLVADEPTAELDTVAEAQVLRLLRQATDRGVAVIVATHSPRVTAMADRVVELHDGQVRRGLVAVTP